MTIMQDRHETVTKDEWSPFASSVYKLKYEQENEGWEGTAARVVDNVMRPLFPELADEMTQAIIDRKFMPGGRYLYASGKKFHQTQNCLLLRAADSREGWADLMYRVTSGLMTGAGIGVVYTDLRGNGSKVNGMGGDSTGPLALMQMVNETGRHIMQGGSRRAAIWAGLHWYHPDAKTLIVSKDWSEDIVAMKDKNFNAAAPLDMTNISIILDDDFFEAMENPNYRKVFEIGDNKDAFVVTHDWAQSIYWSVVEHMLTTAEPGFSIDTGANKHENLRNAPVTADTHVLTEDGYRKVREILDEPVTVWTGKQWAEDVKFTRTMLDADVVKVTMTGGREIRCEPTHEFLVERYSGAGTRRKMTTVDRVPAGKLQEGDILHVSLPNDRMPKAGFIADPYAYTLGWLYGDGSFRDGRAELTLCSDESKACLPYIAGYTGSKMEDSRGYIRLYWNSGFDGHVKEYAPRLLGNREIRSFIAGLFDADGNWEPNQKRVRLASKHFGFLRDVARYLEDLGIIAHVSKAGISTYGQSQGYQLVVAAEYSERFSRIIPTRRVSPVLDGYSAYRSSSIKVTSVVPDGVEDVYCADVLVDEHSFMAEGVIISNCTEITSEDNDDICNLGSINMARVESKEEFARLVEIGTAFLIAGTEYSLVPYEGVAKTRTKNRRLGLGLMGIYEWLVARGYTYDPNDELAEWLDEYAKSTDIAAGYADRLGISRPVKTRAIAPTGTIGILAETTTGIEPLFAAAMKRRYLKGKDWHFQYVVDATAKRIIERTGVDGDSLETAYALARTPERRIAFQAWVQKWVDHGISSTLNLPSVEEQNFSHKEFGDMLYKYLPKLRGVTCYPDGARGGQPLSVVPFSEADGWEGYEYTEFGNDQACLSGQCGV